MEGATSKKLQNSKAILFAFVVAVGQHFVGFISVTETFIFSTMALLSQSKTLAGSRAFSGLRARVTPVISNGSSKVTMRKDTYMVEVRVPCKA